jgi:UDP-N-acetylmuramoylalanine--D-glutamate ligase
LISLILRQAGYQVHLGGNIGTPLLDHIDTIQPDDMVVLELSSFQLMSMRKSPDVAVVTNITPNHLDVHKDYQEYIDAKRNILLYQPFYGRLVLNAGNYESRSLSTDARGQVFYFSQNDHDLQEGCVAMNGQLVWRSHGQEVPIIRSQDIKIPGRHNVDNYLAAATAVWPYVKPEDIAEVARTFGGVEHRLELVRELNGVRYYNSSIDTSPTRTKAALRALAERGEKVVLIAGGQDKKSDYTGLGEAIVTVSRKIVLCGANSDLIEASLRREAVYKGVHFEDLVIRYCENYADAVTQASELAEPGEIVVLSPAGTSYDYFRHFEERGNLYKDLVKKL